MSGRKLQGATQLVVKDYSAMALLGKILGGIILNDASDEELFLLLGHPLRISISTF